jgi:hypothetical protein
LGISAAWQTGDYFPSRAMLAEKRRLIITMTLSLFFGRQF